MHILSLLLSLIQNFDTSEGKLRREFESYGPVKRVRGCISTCTCTYCIVLLNRVFTSSLLSYIHTHIQINIVFDSENGKPRGYAFVEYENERDMHCKSLELIIVKYYCKVMLSYC